MIQIPDILKLRYKDSGNFFLLAGPCVVESEKIVFEVAEYMVNLTERLQIPFVFKSSYKKANRSRGDSFTGIGNIKALELLGKVAKTFDIPVVTDIHSSDEARMAAEFVDVLQIPAFLCRQTDLLVTAAQTGKYVNIKKGQFLSPEGMQFAIEKITATGNEKVMVTERGTSFGYYDLVVDFRGIPVMKSYGKPVVLDATHSLQQPNQGTGVTGGRPDLIETIASAGIAVGVDGLFMETHPEPSQALSDGANMLPMSKMEKLLKKLINIQNAAKT